MERRWCEMCHTDAEVNDPRAKVKWYILDEMGVDTEIALCRACARDLREQGISLKPLKTS